MTSEPRMRRRFSDLDAALDYLAAFTDYEQKHAATLDRKSLDLGRVRDLVRAFASPHEAFPSVHVAGSKGKGSTCMLIRALAEACGRRTGLFLSPHLTRIVERIQIAARPIDDTAFVALVEEISEFVEEHREAAPMVLPSFFEAMTLMGFLAFRREGVELAVLEVGMGGRLDATNVVVPEVAVITALDLEHTRLLGDTLAAIAFEKAGIVKPGRPVVSALDPESAEGRVVAGRADEDASPLLSLDREIRVRVRARRTDGSQVIDVAITPPQRHAGSCTFAPWSWRDVELAVSGDHQARNAAGALATMLLLERRGVLELDEEGMRRALAEIVLPARLEWFPARTEALAAPLLLDCAHTPASMTALAASVAARFAEARPILVLGMLRDKRVEDCLARIAGLFDDVWTVAPDSPRAIAPVMLAEAVAAAWPNARVEPIEPLDDLRGRLAQQGPQGFVVAGSVYLAGVVRGWLQAP